MRMEAHIFTLTARYSPLVSCSSPHLESKSSFRLAHKNEISSSLFWPKIHFRYFYHVHVMSPDYLRFCLLFPFPLLCFLCLRGKAAAIMVPASPQPTYHGQHSKSPPLCSGVVNPISHIAPMVIRILMILCSSANSPLSPANLPPNRPAAAQATQPHTHALSTASIPDAVSNAPKAVTANTTSIVSA